MFWLGGAPYLYPRLPWDFMGIYQRISLFTVHTLPLFFSLTNIHLTDMRLLKTDSQKVFLFSMSYMGANALGTYERGTPVYPYADWSNIPLTIFYYTLLALIISVTYKYAANYVNTKLPFRSIRE
mmetsp:Transcript_6765/g.11362  ORF Transcript_6765/g.11362 Transcript_6765/m.11362 type:complete len:125 (-) Transcript_6765:145-519(-)|eukprot:CAMPEP_0168617970 /NCGR_PEP_ID=MMETSP0449_2-20121227/5822_1 /TAXON_ID=1082188 /ORGANISM="Strombidium rassoulzadegani, Strain ras09" /LENGTH=124 /DNA_ID=CAMNT_0008658813 /DNA_START=376 /DNA_END=750 /DNA_ORIENTATION=-